MQYRFQGQHPHEDVILISHHHPFFILPHLKWVLVVAWLPFLLYIFMPFSQLLILFFLCCFIFSASTLAVIWYGWQNSVLLLTSERLIMVEQKGLFKRHFNECSLLAVQQVSHQIKGVLQTVFGYGTIEAYTNSSQEPFRIAYIPDPYELQQAITEAQQSGL